ncbi:uncharacterized protein LOC134822155 [Bolinopsis microptera]|uniref:uncharacterized protein LOC134822155 n=1 Tax=Bolinopsis microptera TaxID=2820187 RepID=UPI003079972D
MNIAIAIIVAMVARAQSLLCYECKDSYLAPIDKTDTCKLDDRVWCKGEEVCSTTYVSFVTGNDKNWIRGHNCMDKALVDATYSRGAKIESDLAASFEDFSDFTFEIELCEENLCNSEIYLIEPVLVCNKPTIDNGVVSPDRLTIGSGFTYSVTCDEGFVISGSPTINCDGDQLSEPPTCKIGACKVELAEVKDQLEIAKCPEQPTWSVPKQLLGKKLTRKTLKKLMRKPETQNVGNVLKKYKGTKLTNGLAKYIECYTDMTEA